MSFAFGRETAFKELRKSNFLVDVPELPNLSHRTWQMEMFNEKSIVFEVLESEDMSTLKMLKELKEKKYPIFINLMSRNGLVVHTFKIENNTSYYSLKMDYNGNEDIATWKVVVS